jgi:hypothetical protein
MKIPWGFTLPTHSSLALSLSLCVDTFHGRFQHSISLH